MHQKNSVIRIVQEIKQLNPDIVVIAGDLADGSLQVKQDWLKPFDTLADIGAIIADNFDLEKTEIGTSILNELD